MVKEKAFAEPNGDSPRNQASHRINRRSTSRGSIPDEIPHKHEAATGKTEFLCSTLHGGIINMGVEAHVTYMRHTIGHASFQYPIKPTSTSPAKNSWIREKTEALFYQNRVSVQMK